jgi:hypothetical protein
MMVIEKDPVVIVDRVRNMIMDIIELVYDAVILTQCTQPIEKLQKEIGDMKFNFPMNCKGKTKEEKKAERDKINDKALEIEAKKILRDQLELSFLYIGQGVQVLMNGFITSFGEFAPLASSISIKGNGKIALMATGKHMVYVSNNQETGTITPAFTEALDTAEIVFKSAKVFKNIGFGIEKLVRKSNEL